MIEKTVLKRLLEDNTCHGDWKSWFKLRTVVSSAAIEVSSLQSWLLSHRLKAFSRRSSDPQVIAASRISPKSLAHHQRRVARERTMGGLDDSLNIHPLHTHLPYHPAPLFPHSAHPPKYTPFCRQALGSSRGCKDRLSRCTPPPKATASDKKTFFSKAC